MQIMKFVYGFFFQLFYLVEYIFLPYWTRLTFSKRLSSIEENRKCDSRCLFGETLASSWNVEIVTQDERLDKVRRWITPISSRKSIMACPILFVADAPPTGHWHNRSKSSSAVENEIADITETMNRDSELLYYQMEIICEFR